MSVHFAYTNGEILSLKPGLPPGYNGPVLYGASAAHFKATFGELIVQEVNTEYVSIRSMFVNWKKPERLICHYNYPTGIFTRVQLHSSLHEYLKGAGEIHLRKDQFATLLGNKWTGLIIGEKPGEHHWLDISWSAEYLQNALHTEPMLKSALGNICTDIPDRVTGPAHTVNHEMNALLSSLHYLDFAVSKIDTLHRVLKKYFNAMLHELKEQQSIREKMKLTDWSIINNAKELIDNENSHFSTPKLSAVIGMNEHKLKKLFLQVTGFNVDEYRKFGLCMKTAKQIIRQPDEPLKMFSTDAGYTSLTAFIRGFRKLCYCTPGELRTQTWDLSGIPDSKFTT